MRSVLIAIALLVAGAVSATTLYRWVDKNGVVHYSDRPVAGAEKIDLRETQTYTPKRLPQQSTPTNASAGSATDSGYRELMIYRPKNDETLVNTGNEVTVRLRLDPALQQGHAIWLYLDGRRIDGLPGDGDTFELKEVWRGTHTLNAVVTDSAGKSLISSPPITFHMRQTSVLSPRSPAAAPRPGGG